MHSVLVYHTISNRAEALPGDIDITPENFEKQLRWLSRWRSVARLQHTLRSPFGNRLIALTFDDGFRDNLIVALPLLEKFQLPMTLFVTPGFLDTDDYLSKAELHEMSKHPLVTIGAHGLLHRHFSRLSYEEAKYELIESKLILEDITSNRIEFMAWPFGDCEPWLEQLSAECGYRASWSVWKGSNSKHSLRRVPLGRRDNLPRFIAKVAGAYGPTKDIENKVDAFKSRLPRLFSRRSERVI
jgi:peptidoglycan/xylan/chitin deacetylase (PgdA/CDA1 family)